MFSEQGDEDALRFSDDAYFETEDALRFSDDVDYDDLIFQTDEELYLEAQIAERIDILIKPVSDQSFEALIDLLIEQSLEQLLADPCRKLDDYQQFNLLMNSFMEAHPQARLKVHKKLVARIITIIHQQNPYAADDNEPLLDADEAVKITLTETFKSLACVPTAAFTADNFNDLLLGAFIVTSKNIHAFDGNDWYATEYAQAFGIPTGVINACEYTFLKRIDYAIPVFPAIPPTLSVDNCRSSLQALAIQPLYTIPLSVINDATVNVKIAPPGS